jgi:hypothetical protein
MFIEFISFPAQKQAFDTPYRDRENSFFPSISPRLLLYHAGAYSKSNT